MRDNFYHWLALTVLLSVSFGAHLARAIDGNPNLYNVLAFGGIAALATAGTINSFRRKGAPTNGR